MGYESRLYIVKVDRQMNHVEAIAAFQCGVMDSEKNGWKKLFSNSFDYTMYAEDNDTEIVEDDCGDSLKCADFSSVIEWLEKEIQRNDYRRLKPLLSLLKGFDLTKWTDGEMWIVHYGC